jgi:hypothetical protein
VATTSDLPSPNTDLASTAKVTQTPKQNARTTTEITSSFITHLFQLTSDASLLLGAEPVAGEQHGSPRAWHCNLHQAEIKHSHAYLKKIHADCCFFAQFAF